MTTINARTIYESPLGPLTLTASPAGLTGLAFPGHASPRSEATHDQDRFAETIAQLEEYFAGDRRCFELPLDLAGTPFQRTVWATLAEIPCGSTITYGTLARRVGRPDRVRAVAAAVGRTPTPIIVPCHRVLAADGGLTGYLGGLQRKQALLEHESRLLTGQPTAVDWRFRQLALQ